ncbi:MAG: hypothetical protein F6K40_17330 [Okeania sp. SIO3I5]|uniref:hypothetical protein n=1 Tax=Okeania sp. SIO3I5 TaxID=2607805 RepID=UPI0013BDBEF0|nr:hypothetical protein [Okeania sp. SIO3I5]NEQ37928.1 hypothetical protein [Okeania sp. SIO3I5]
MLDGFLGNLQDFCLVKLYNLSGAMPNSRKLAANSISDRYLLKSELSENLQLKKYFD